MLHDDRSKVPDTPACAGPQRRRSGLTRMLAASPAAAFCASRKLRSARAMAKGQAAAADRSAVERILPTFTKIDVEAASVINLGSYPTTLSKARLRRVVDLMVTFGLLPSPDKAGLNSMLSTP